MKEVTVGVDIGGTNTKVGIVDREGNFLADSSIPTDGYSDVDVFIYGLHQQIEKLLQPIKDQVVLKGIGIGAPNGNYYKGTIEYAPNLNWKGIVPFVDLLKKHYNLPIALTNDANAAAIGEMVFGAAQNMKDFIMVTLGTGLGSGFVANGQLIYGHDGFAGELGHIVVNPNGRDCGCGRKGCLETYVSATGIKRTVYKLLADHREESILRKIAFDGLSAEMITDAALKGDKIALEAFEYTGRVLGEKLADAVTFTSPEAIILFGGLVNAGELLFKPIRFHMEKSMMNIFKGKVKLIPSGLMNKNAAILGASAIIWNELRKPEYKNLDNLIEG